MTDTTHTTQPIDLTPANLDRMAGIARAATQGEWHVRKEDVGDEDFYLAGYWVDDANDINICDTDPDHAFGTLNEENAAHIAEFSPPTVLAMIAEIERMREALLNISMAYHRRAGCNQYFERCENARCSAARILIGITGLDEHCVGLDPQVWAEGVIEQHDGEHAREGERG